MNKRVALSIVVIATAAGNYYLKYVFAYCILGEERYNSLSTDLRSMLIQVTTLLLCLLVAFWVSSFSVRKVIALLGMEQNPGRALLYALLCTLPMFAGGYYNYGFHYDIHFADVFMFSLWPGFNEELICRAYMIGVLVKICRWKFIPAVLVSAIVFAYGHLYQADDMQSAVAVFLFTSGAAIGFSAFYKLWNCSVWFPMFMHILMNLSFVLFYMGNNVLLNGPGNIFRGVMIVLGIVLSIMVWKKATEKKEQMNEGNNPGNAIK